MTDAVLDQSARVTHIPAPIASPGHCAICGKSEHPLGFAATDNFDFDFYGTIIFCADCVGDYARVFGYMSQEQVAEVKRLVTKQAEEIAVLRESVVNLENILDAYAKLRNHTDDSSSDWRNSSPSPEDPVHDSSETVTEPTDDGESREGTPAKPVSVERHDDVHGPTADDLFAELGL